MQRQIALVRTKKQIGQKSKCTIGIKREIYQNHIGKGSKEVSEIRGEQRGNTGDKVYP